MKTLELEDFCLFYASKCEKCHGQKRVQIQGVWYACSCQIIASARWRLNQIRIHPPELKFLTWDDFTGVIKEQDIQTGMLRIDSVLDAKAKAIAYCYKNGDITCPDDLILHKRASEGSNLIIGGEKNSGKTMLAILLIKEIIRTSVIHNVSLSFEWVSSSEIKAAARWDGVKLIDHARLDELAEVDFLVIDDVDIEVEQVQGKSYQHTMPPDRTSLNMLFGQRDLFHRPTILLCSQRLLRFAESPMYLDTVSQQWGVEFVHILTNKKNIVIHLERERLE